MIIICILIYFIGVTGVLTYLHIKKNELDGDDITDAIMWPFILFVLILFSPFYFSYLLAKLTSKKVK